jgi:hypothetical protein
MIEFFSQRSKRFLSNSLETPRQGLARSNDGREHQVIAARSPKACGMTFVRRRPSRFF